MNTNASGKEKDRMNEFAAKQKGLTKAAGSYR